MSCGEADHSETSNLWIVGIVISIAGSCASNGGVNLQKMSIMKEMKLARSNQRPYILQPLWLIGLLGVVFGAIADFGALAFAAQSLLTPVGGFTVVANCWFARICLGERMSRKDGIATLLITIGIVMIATSGDKGDTCYTLQQLVVLYGEPSFVGYIIGTGVTVIGLYAFHKYANRIRAVHGPWSPLYTRIRRAHMITYPVLSGVMGAQSVLFAKSTAELIKETARGTNQLKYFGFYAILAALIFTIVSQLHWLAIALKNADALLVIPIFQSFFIIISIIGGGVYFKELDKLSQTNTAIFCAGVMIMMSGIYMLAQRSLGGSSEPPRMTFLTLAAQFVVRARRAARFRQASRWPNRLHLYSCNCDCHWEEKDGHNVPHNNNGKLLNLPSSSTNPGRPLETIMDAPIDDDEIDDDEHHSSISTNVPLTLDHHPSLHYHPHPHDHNLRHRHNHIPHDNEDNKNPYASSPTKSSPSSKQTSSLSILDPPRIEGYERVLTETNSPGRNYENNLRQRNRSQLSQTPILNNSSNSTIISPNDLGIIHVDDTDSGNGASRDGSKMDSKKTPKEQLDDNDYTGTHEDNEDYDDPPTLPDAPTHDAYGNELPPMCKYCWCRLTPLPVIDLYKKLSPNYSSANVVSHLLPNMGVNVIDDGSSDNGMNIMSSGRLHSETTGANLAPSTSSHLSSNATVSSGAGALPLPLTTRAQLQSMPSMSTDWDRALAEVNGTSHTTNGGTIPPLPTNNNNTTASRSSVGASRTSAGALDSERTNSSGFSSKNNTSSNVNYPRSSSPTIGLSSNNRNSVNSNMNNLSNTTTNATNSLFQGTYFRPDDPSSVGVKIYNLRSNNDDDDDDQSPANYLSRGDDPLGLDLPLTIPRLQDIGDGLARLRSGTATGIRFVGNALGTALGSVAGAVVAGTNPSSTGGLSATGTTGTNTVNNTIASSPLPGGRVTSGTTKQSPAISTQINTGNPSVTFEDKRRSPNAVKRSPSSSSSPNASIALSSILRPVAKAVSSLPAAIPPTGRGTTETIAFQTLHDDDGADEHLTGNSSTAKSDTSPGMSSTNQDRMSPTRSLRITTSSEDNYVRIVSPETPSSSEFHSGGILFPNPSNSTSGSSNEGVSSSYTPSLVNNASSTTATSSSLNFLPNKMVPKPLVVIDPTTGFPPPPARRLRSSTSTDGDTSSMQFHRRSGKTDAFSSHAYRSASAERTRTDGPVSLQRKRSAPAISPNDTTTHHDRIPSLVRSSTVGGADNSTNNNLGSTRSRNPRRRQRGPHLDQPFPPPGAVVVGAGLEAATFLTVAAIKRLLSSNLNNKKDTNAKDVNNNSSSNSSSSSSSTAPRISDDTNIDHDIESFSSPARSTVAVQFSPTGTITDSPFVTSPPQAVRLSSTLAAEMDRSGNTNLPSLYTSPLTNNTSAPVTSPVTPKFSNANNNTPLGTHTPSSVPASEPSSASPSRKSSVLAPLSPEIHTLQLPLRNVSASTAGTASNSGRQTPINSNI